MLFADFFGIDFAPLIAAILSALCCSLCGNFLLVRGHSMTVDAISHTVLPGMVVIFLIVKSISFFYLFWGALFAALSAIFIIEILARIQDRDAVMGMIFSVLFALGVLLLELFVDRKVHFDVTHILFGSLESVYWVDLGVDKLSIWDKLVKIPNSILLLLSLSLFIILLITLFYKEIVLVCFDYEFARIAYKHKAYFIYYAIPIVITMTIVAAFKLVGLILIVGMFVIPPLIATFLTHSIKSRILISGFISVSICIIGYDIAIYFPLLYSEHQFGLNIGGAIVSTGGLLLLLIILFKRMLIILKLFK